MKRVHLYESNGYWAALWAGACVIASDVGAAILAELEVMAVTAEYCLAVAAGCLLLTADTDVYCQNKYNACMETPLGDNGTRGGSTMCGKCLEFCLAQGYWECPED
jgi:hypothetical protein